MNPGCTHPQGIIWKCGNPDASAWNHDIPEPHHIVKGKSTLALITGLDTFPLIFLMIELMIESDRISAMHEAAEEFLGLPVLRRSEYLFRYPFFHDDSPGHEYHMA